MQLNQKLTQPEIEYFFWTEKKHLKSFWSIFEIETANV